MKALDVTLIIYPFDLADMEVASHPTLPSFVTTL